MGKIVFDEEFLNQQQNIFAGEDTTWQQELKDSKKCRLKKSMSNTNKTTKEQTNIILQDLISTAKKLNNKR